MNPNDTKPEQPVMTVREVLIDLVWQLTDDYSRDYLEEHYSNSKLAYAEQSINTIIRQELEGLGIKPCPFESDGDAKYDTSTSVCVWCGERKYRPQHVINKRIKEYENGNLH